MTEARSFETWVQLYQKKGGSVQPATLRKVKLLGELDGLLPRFRVVNKSYFSLTQVPLGGVIDVVKKNRRLRSGMRAESGVCKT